jgi:hypothetical protein
MADAAYDWISKWTWDDAKVRVVAVAIKNVPPWKELLEKSC